MLSWRTARGFSGLSVAVVLVFGMLMPSTAHAAGTEVTGGTPGQAAPPEPPAVKVAKTKVPATASDDTGKAGTDKVVAELPKTSTPKFRMIGVTWSAQGLSYGIKVEVRTRTDGAWSAWTLMDYDGDNGEAGNPGTDPLWIGKADGVAARVTAEVGAPQDVRITTIDPGSDGDPATASTASNASDTSFDGVARTSTAVDLGDGNPTYTPKPAIITRSQWGAAAGTSCDSPLTGDRTRGAVVHHTAGSNSYAKADSMAIVRATQAYHVKGRGWCDIGYNFLVDKYGQIFEGRRGGVDRAVRAAHSGNLTVNTYTMGISMMGNYDVTRPTAELKAAMVKLIGWRLGTNFVKAKGTYSIGGLTLNRIAGHRNVVSTACPGRYGYAWLSETGGLRDRVEAYMSKYSTPIKSRYTSLGSASVGNIYIGEARSSTGSRLDAKLKDLYSKSTSTAARYVSGKIRTEYDRLGSRTGTLGYPTDNPTTATDGVIGQHFDTGSIFYVSGKTTAYSLRGDIAKVYTQLGESTGKLGDPTSSTFTVSSGVTRNNFQRGWIISTKSTGKTVAYSSTGTVIGTTSTTSPTTAPATVSQPSVTAGYISARVNWTAVANATSYDLCLVADKTQSTCTRLLTGLTTTTALLSDLKPTAGTDWYVKVRASDDGVRGLWSIYRGFNLQIATTTDAVTVPSTRTIAVTGHGYGHGIGMSQHGAQGAAKQGVGYASILSRYYPGTTLGGQTGNIRVLISQDTTDSVDIVGRSGLVFRNVKAGTTMALPTTIYGSTVTRWRIVQLTSDKTQSTLQYRTTGDYKSFRGVRWTGDGQFEGPPSIGLIMPSGSAAVYRGAIRSAVPSSGSTSRNTVNILTIERYVRGVIAAEMPSSWMPEALKAQAVAARTYGVRSISSTRYYDICSTTACQVYGGVSRETANTNAAVSATNGKVLRYDGKPAFTQFSSSSGGYTSPGSQPYLKAVSDTWDNWSGNANHTWTKSVSAATIEKAYPAIGTLKQLKITNRNGYGDWGGRVSTISLVGSSSTVTISGDQARWAFGLKSNWFRF
ncbi:SpoIID/LytB domain-containing protein [Aeromicrobium sp.]|uniref:SpoIID/LytB domain-containing protein n=1 Tax=Aeromicrobium sp. TaxID=1871063 RepID=UPI002FC6EDED